MSEATHRFVMLAEDRINARSAAVLVDRVLAEKAAPVWLQEWFAASRVQARAWTHAAGDRGESFDRGTYSKLDHIRAFCPRARALRRSAGAKAAAVSKAFHCVELTVEREPASAAIIAIDVDDDPSDASEMQRMFDEQRAVFESGEACCVVLLALAQPESEAWCVAAVTKSTENEATIAGLRRELGFDPIDNLRELTSTSKTAKRDCKRVFEALLDHRDSGAALAVIEEAPLDAWILRGESCGIRAFADAVLTRLCPALAR